MLDPTQRFSSRVHDYVRYRPSYPPELIDEIVRRTSLSPGAAIADVGSGTGILSELFWLRGHRVFGIEPNPEMRQAAETLLGARSSFVSVDGRAEATTLPDASVALVAAAQAFHWFDHARARAEFHRILTPPRWVVLIWNERRIDSTPFLVDYERLLRTHIEEYAAVCHRAAVGHDDIRRFFFPEAVELLTSQNFQELDFDGLRGRFLSSSYVPQPGDPAHEPLFRDLRRVFDLHAKAGRVRVEYETTAFLGRLASPSASST
jgi:SAM-dependent methyltransferase